MFAKEIQPNGTIAYREESTRVPLMITVLAIVILATPLSAWIVKINRVGTQFTDVTKYKALVQIVGSDLVAINGFLRLDEEGMKAMNASRKDPVVTLIVPEVVIVEDRQKPTVSPLKAELEGIYWSPDNPLVGIGGETYRVGDVIQGYEIVHIGKTKVQFQAADGTIIMKDMYDNLLKRK